jgi:hypothetical protein
MRLPMLRMIITVKVSTPALAKPNFTRRSMIGTMCPRRLMTPLM